MSVLISRYNNQKGAHEEQQSKVDVIKAVGRLLFIFLMRDYYIGSLQSWGAHRAAQEIGLQVKNL